MSNYVKFDEAYVLGGHQQVEDEERHGVVNAISPFAANSFVIRSENPEKEKVGLEVRVFVPVQEEVRVLEVAFEGGKQRRTRFAVEYIDVHDKKHNIGSFTSSGTTTNFEKFELPSKIKDFKGLSITFLGNDDRFPYFMVRGVRMAKDIDKPL